MFRKTIFRSMPAFASLMAILSFAALFSFSAGPVAAAPLHSNLASSVPCFIDAGLPEKVDNVVQGTGTVACNDGGKVLSLTVQLQRVGTDVSDTEQGTISSNGKSATATATISCHANGLRTYQTFATAIVQKGSGPLLTLMDASDQISLHCS